MPKYLFLGGSKHGKFEEVDISDTILKFCKPIKTPEVVDLKPGIYDAEIEYEYYYVYQLRSYNMYQRVLPTYEPDTAIILTTKDYNADNLLEDMIKAYAKSLQSNA